MTNVEPLKIQFFKILDEIDKLEKSKDKTIEELRSMGYGKFEYYIDLKRIVVIEQIIGELWYSIPRNTHLVHHEDCQIRRNIRYKKFEYSPSILLTKQICSFCYKLVVKSVVEKLDVNTKADIMFYNRPLANIIEMNMDGDEK